MSEDYPPLTVLRRKAGARPGPPPPPRGMSPEKALRQALTKSGEGLPGLDILVHDQTSTLTDQTELIAQLPQIALFTLADGPGDARGLICFGPEFVDALIEVQTMGRVDKATRPPRPTTRIDAALTRDFVETILSDFAGRVASLPDARWARGFKYGTYVPDPTPLSLMMEEGDYRLQTLTLDLGSGAKRAKMWLALPAVAAHVSSSGAGPSAATPHGNSASAAIPVARRADPVWAARMKAVASEAPVELRATLTRFNVPLGRLRTLKVGDTLTISRGALGALEVQGAGPGQTLKGRLGQQNGMRAVRLSVTGPATAGTQTMAAAGIASASAAPQIDPPAPSMADFPMPGASDFPELPDLPGLPDLPDFPGADALPDLPSLGDAPGTELPDLPGLPPLGGPMDGLPDLPDLPDLPSLPDLPPFE